MKKVSYAVLKAKTMSEDLDDDLKNAKLLCKTYARRAALHTLFQDEINTARQNRSNITELIDKYPERVVELKARKKFEEYKIGELTGVNIPKVDKESLLEIVFLNDLEVDIILYLAEEIRSSVTESSKRYRV